MEMKKTLLCAALLAAGATAAASESRQDSLYLFSYTTSAANNTTGLHLAWSADGQRWQKIGGEFAFNVPFSFGENLKFAVRDTLDGMPEILSTLVRSANVRISGTVTTTIPVNVNLRAYFLDAWMDRIDMPEITQLINGTASAGTPQDTPLELTVPQTDIREDISALVFEFELLSGQTPGIPLSEDSSIQADIILNVPGGVTVDINDLNN